MEINSLPTFELDLELETNDQVKDQDNEKVEEVDISSNKSDTSYGDAADPLAVQTYEHLKENGVIIENPDNPFDGTWDKLNESLNTLPQRVLSSIIDEAPDISKQVVKWAFSSQNVTAEDFKEFAKAYLEELDTNTEIETMDEARSYLESVYKERGLRSSVIRAALDSLEEDDALIEEAKSEYEKQLENKNSKTNSIIERNKQSDQDTLNAQQEFVSKVSEELDSTGWTSTKVSKVKEVMSNNNMSNVLSEIVKNPKALVKLADFLTHYDTKSKDIDYSAFISKAETKQAKSFKDKVEIAINTPNSNTKSTLTNPNSDWDDLKPIIN